jgi:serine/threonine-protein kinase
MMTIAVGTKLGRYEIRSQIGAGGMGEVFLALDTELDRTVAIKILPEALATDQQRLQRFVQEAKAASALNHPHILTIYEIGATGASRFIATEFIDGETLRQRINAGLKLVDILEFSIQICSALGAAHAAGIMHRDIKPENVMVRRDGYIKVLDFGLAKLTDPKGSITDTEAPTRAMVNTGAGTVMGTANYMSPEQAKGTTADARTDLWSLGAVLYEMITGHVPFPGETPTESISLILQKAPAPMTRYTHDIPAELERIVTKALTKDREERYQTAKDLLIDLRNLKRKLEVDAEIDRTMPPEFRGQVSAASTSSGQSTPATDSGSVAPTAFTSGAAPAASSAEYIVSGIKQHKIAVVAGLVLLAVAAGVIGLSTYLRARNTEVAIRSIAVMPFVNESGNQDVEYLSDGMTETLISSLSQVPNLSVKARSTVFRYKGRATDAKTIGKELNVQAVLNGRVSQRGDQLTLSVELVDVATENAIWSKQYTRRLSDAQAVQGEIAQEVSAKLRLKLAGEGAPGTKNQTVSPETYQAYLKGRYYYSQDTEESLQKAIEQYNRAISLEPNYAQAFAGLASVYTEMSSVYLPPSEAMPKAKQAVLKALALDGALAEAHMALAEIHWWSDWDFPAAEQEFKRAIELNPNQPKVSGEYAQFLARTLGRFDEGITMADRALQLDPLALDILYSVADTFYSARQYDREAEAANKILELDRNSRFGHFNLGRAYLLKGQNEQAIAELQKAVDPQSGFGLDRLGWAYGVAGRKSEALKTLTELQALAERKYVPPHSFAYIYAGLGDKERAFEWLEKGYTGRDDALTRLKTEPMFDSLRPDPRFTDLMRRVGLPQ